MLADQNQHDTENTNTVAEGYVNVVGKKILGVRGAHHRHTGRHIPIHYTSYALLFFILAFTGLTLLFARFMVQAETDQGSVTVSATVYGPPPSTPAVITAPSAGKHLTVNTTNISGTCEANKLIEIYRSTIFAGSTSCSSGGLFELSVTLIPNQNDLVARTKDNVGQYGPNSATVTVYYDVPSSPSGGGDGSTNTGENETPAVRTPQTPNAPPPLLLTTDPVYRGLSPNQTVKIKFEVDGGNPPYAISISWGDGSLDDLLSKKADGNYIAEHKYKSSGQYTVTIIAKDADGRKALIQTVVTINGFAAASGAANSGEACQTTQCYVSDKLTSLINIMWVPFSIASLMAISFWIGEKIILARLKLPNPKT